MARKRDDSHKTIIGKEFIPASDVAPAAEILRNHYRVLSLIHHDLKSPLLGLQGISGLLLDNFSTMSTEDHLRLIALIHRTSAQTFKLVDQLFSWAQIQNSIDQSRPKAISLASFLKENLLLSANTAEKKTIQLVLECSDDISISADENMLGSVVQNLLDNAVKFTAVGGKIHLICKVKGNSVEIKIRDSGVGMSAETLSSIFVNPNHKSTLGTAGEKGTGLGLVLVKTFSDNNSWHLSVTSQLGSGTEFLFRVPLLSDSPFIPVSA